MTTDRLHNRTNAFVALHHALLELHKTLLEYQKRKYEGLNGKIESANDYFTIVTTDPSFEWLRKLSGFMVSLEEANESEEENARESEQNLLKYLDDLLTADEEGEGFARKYFKALQSSPEVAHAHGVVMRETKKLQTYK